MTTNRKCGGYEITDCVQIGETEYVIGHNPIAAQPYAVWRCEDDDYYWGHYFSDRESAERDIARLINQAIRLFYGVRIFQEE